MKVQQLSNNAGTGSEYPELAATLTVKTTGPGNWLRVFFFSVEQTSLTVSICSPPDCQVSVSFKL